MKKKKSTNCESPDGNTTKLIKGYLKEKLINGDGDFRHHNEEYNHIKELIKRTIELGESNSALLIGPRGSGKTVLINNVINELTQLINVIDDSLIVRLNGLIHTDDRLALKDATRQMELENAVGDKVFGTFAENLNFLLECLKSGNRKRSKPCLFLIDEFDLFCNHQNQTLLYNLFDVAQSSQAPICVIGITCRLDVIELLEKRVKSRFSHRQIFIFPGDNKDDLFNKNSDDSDDSAFDNRVKLFRDLMAIHEKEIAHQIGPNHLKNWNKSIDDLASNVTVINLLKNMYDLDVSERNFKNFLVFILSLLNEDHPLLEVDDFLSANRIFFQDDKKFMLEGLSVLELCLVIAMKHETEIYDGEPVNFETIYHRYNKFVNQTSSIQSVQRPVIIKAFERIKNLELLTPVGSSNTNTEKEFQYFKFLLTSQQVVDAVKNYNGLPTEVAQWATDYIQ